jgi:glycosyltransferase involved in cell wall biosynthesis
MHTLLCVLYFAVLILLSSYGIHRSHLVYQCWRHRRKIERALEAGRQPVPEGELPHVTVQLPLFNEATVAVRLLEATTRLDYPRDRLEIQVLDDSTDETQSIARSTVERLRREGTDIVYIHRVDRSGYKAGALANGLKVAKGELVAVFDADFIPSPEFLKATVGHFRTPTVGMVQTRWGHLNRDFSLLTQVQALMLDGHHLVENRARFAAGNLFNFSGTGGIWRKRAIFEAGGWEHDTLTEDLDLSYRAQLAGWRFVYRPDVVSPAELPEDVSAFRAQQYRWAKGTVQTSRKLIARVLRSPLTLGQRLEAFFHLTPHFAYPLMVLLSVLLLPALIFMPATDTRTMLLVDLPLTLGTTGSLGAFYALAEAAQGRSRLGALARLPMLIALGAGLAPHLSKAVFEGLRQMSGEFVRTPKKGMLEGRYRARATIPFTEIGLSMLSVVSVLASIETHHFFATPFAMLFALGYGYVALLVIAEQVQRRREGRVSVAPSSAPAADSERNPLVSDLAALPRGNTRARGGPPHRAAGPSRFCRQRAAHAADSRSASSAENSGVACDVRCSSSKYRASWVISGGHPTSSLAPVSAQSAPSLSRSRTSGPASAGLDDSHDDTGTSTSDTSIPRPRSSTTARRSASSLTPPTWAGFAASALALVAARNAARSPRTSWITKLRPGASTSSNLGATAGGPSAPIHRSGAAAADARRSARGASTTFCTCER